MHTSDHRKKIVIDGISIAYIQKSEDPHTILFLGLGQSGSNLHTVANTLPDNFVVVEAIPFWKKRSEGYDAVTAFAIKAVHSLLETIGNGTYTIYAESQAAPAIVSALKEDSSRSKELILLSPLGFNASSLGTTQDERYHELMKRSRQFWQHPNQRLTLRGNWTTIHQITKSTLTLPKNVRADYTFGANQDVTDQAMALAEKIPVTIYAGENDSLFPLKEITQSVAGSHISIESLGNVTHLNRATPIGIAQLQKVISQHGSNR